LTVPNLGVTVCVEVSVKGLFAVFVAVGLWAMSAAGGSLVSLPLHNTGEGLLPQAGETAYTFAYWNTDSLAQALLESPTMDNMPAWVVESSGERFPFDPGHWMADTETSQWIAPRAVYADDGVQSVEPLSVLGSDPVGIYRVRFLLDLTGFIPSTASITGRWSPDNSGLALYVNGVDANHSAPFFDVGTPAFEQWYGFDLEPNLFGEGMNTLDFYVYNQPDTLHNPFNYGNPAGIRVEMAGTGEPIPIPPEPLSAPEPSSLAFAALALVAGLFVRATRPR
jgi:hypothetical protein